MWDKARELTDYTDHVYEIAYAKFDQDKNGLEISAKEALDSWKKSTGHRNIVINKKDWKKSNWQAIGIAIKDGFACVWFGESLDVSDLND